MERIISLVVVISVVGLIAHGPLVAANSLNKRSSGLNGANRFKESTVLGCSDPTDPSCRPSGPIYDLLIVGGGMAGLSSQYFAITRANVPGNSTILFEKEVELGGNIKYVNVTAFDGTTRRRVGTGSQRTPQNTVPHQRALWDELNVTTYYVVWNSRFVGRGRVSQCPAPDLLAYSPISPYGITIACAGNFAMAGNLNGVLSPILDNETTVGPAYWIDRNSTIVDQWDYPLWYPIGATGFIGGSPYSNALEDAFYNHELYNDPNPVNGEACTEEVDCPSDTCYDFAEIHTFEQSLFGREYTNFIRELANLGFNGDYFGLTWSPCGRIQYYRREWDTTTIYGYSDNSMHTGIDKLRDRIVMGGGRIYTNEEVLTVDYLDKYGVFLVTTNKRRVFSKRVIGSFEPNAVKLGKINGNIPDALRAEDAFKIPVNGTAFTFTVLFDKTSTINGQPAFFWDDPTIVAPEVVTTYGVSKRQIGTDGCGSRREILSYPDVYDDETGTGAIRSSYTDFLCQGVYIRILEMTKSTYPVTAKRGWEMLWERLKLDIVAELGVSDASLVPDPRLIYDKSVGGERFEIYPARFDNAWFGTGRDRLDNGNKFTVDDIIEFAKNPVNLPGKFCLAQQAWNNRASGWTEASIITATECIKTMFPCTASSGVFENWISDYFPQCEDSNDLSLTPEDLCYSGGGSDNSTIVGGLYTTAIVVPGLNEGGVTNAKFFCNERWWTNGFNKTVGCVGPQPIRSCAAP